MQAFALVSDDVMDKSLTRRGQPCWYRQASENFIVHCKCRLHLYDLSSLTWL